MEAAATRFHGEGPCDHAVIDNFFDIDLARALEAKIPSYESDEWHEYDNPLEVKKTCNNWLKFPPLTYSVFNFLNSAEMVDRLENLLKIEPLYADSGLNGGGWHIHKRGGKLNCHLDYSVHPKVGLLRKLNLIIYLAEDWQADWGGELGLWEHDPDTGGPGRLAKEIEPRFNRAVIFDTTQNSWHGLPTPLTCPDGFARKSLAVYYLTTPPPAVDGRGKALFAPALDQADNAAVLELIEKRASVAGASEVYRA